MYVRVIPENMYKTFLRNLETNAHREPFDISYHCDIQVNDIRYRLRLYREGRHLYPVQAIRLERDVQKCELITSPIMLGSLTEMVMAQYGKDG